MNAQQTIERVVEIGSIDLLRQMARNENRKGVLKVIQQRIGELSLSDAHTVTAAETLMAGGVETTDDIFSGTDNAALKNEEHAIERGTVTHQTSAFRRMYAPSPDGYVVRMVPEGNVAQNLKAGFKAACPHCGLSTCRSQPGVGPYDCPGMTSRQFMRCPVCSKPVRDPLNPDNSYDTAQANDPNEIPSTGYAQASPKARIEARLDRHMLAYHAEEARIRGVSQSPVDPMLAVQERSEVNA